MFERFYMIGREWGHHPTFLISVLWSTSSPSFVLIEHDLTDIAWATHDRQRSLIPCASTACVGSRDSAIPLPLPPPFYFLLLSNLFVEETFRFYVVSCRFSWFLFPLDIPLLLQVLLNYLFMHHWHREHSTSRNRKRLCRSLILLRILFFLFSCLLLLTGEERTDEREEGRRKELAVTSGCCCC